MFIRTLTGRLAAVAALFLLAACAADNAQMRELGDFRLGHAMVIADEPTKGPFSRDASEAELETAIAAAVDQRLGRYDGDGLYHLGINVGGYVLAQPGLPLVYTPKSVLMLDVTLFDNATGQKITEEPHRITAFEGAENIAPIIGSGIARSKEAQLQNLATSAARAIEAWLAEHPEWFEPRPGVERTPFTAEQRRAARAAN